MTRIMLDRNKTNVDVMENNYKRLKKNAEAERYNVKEYTNTLIKSALDKIDYASQQWPSLGISSAKDNDTITVIDYQTRKLIDLKLGEDGKLHCEEDRDMICCSHVMYALLMPQSALLTNVATPKDNVEKIEQTQTQTVYSAAQKTAND